MKLIKYLDFISEATKSGKMMIFYSDGFREILTMIAKENGAANGVARFLLAAEESNQALDTYTLIDKTDKNDMISYVQSSRFYREYPGIDFEEISAIIAHEELIRNSKFWKTGRTPNYSIGRWVRHVFADVYGTPVPDKDIENFVNAYKSTHDKISKGSEKFVLVKGEDIRYWYLEDRYEEVSGQLGNSCMRHERCQKYLDIYVQNLESCSLLILKGKDPDKIVGRALIWTLHDGSGVAGKKFMDRIYTIKDSDRLLFEAYAKEHDILRSASPSYQIKVKEGRYDYYPYMDTFMYLDTESGILTSSCDGSEHSVLEMQNTDGTSSDTQGRVWSEYHGEYIDEDDARWCVDVDSYVHYEDAIWLEYMDEYVSMNADTVYSEWHEQTFYTEDTVRSECMGDYLRHSDSDIIEFMTNEHGDTDYCPKELTQYYIEVEGEYYSRKDYLKDPYTGKRHFMDENIGGKKYSETIEGKIEEDLGIKEKYYDGSTFNLAKYKEDLRKMMIESATGEGLLRNIKANMLAQGVNSGDERYMLPGLYAWILRDQGSYRSFTPNNCTSSQLIGYRNLFYSILEEIPESVLGTDRSEIKEYYTPRLEIWTRIKPLLRIFEGVDISEFPADIYKMIIYMNL